MNWYEVFYLDRRFEWEICMGKREGGGEEERREGKRKA